MEIYIHPSEYINDYNSLMKSKMNSRNSRKLKCGFKGEGSHKYVKDTPYGKLTDIPGYEIVNQKKVEHYNNQVSTAKHIGLFGNHVGSKSLKSIKHQLREYNKAVVIRNNQ